MRIDTLKGIKRIVVKIGSAVLTEKHGALDKRVIKEIASGLVAIRQKGIQVVLVSSGAVAAGRSELGMTEKPKTIPQKQAAAAIGQTTLMQAYQQALHPFKVKAAQLLLTSEDIESRQRFLNTRATIDTLLALGVIPIINENDTVVVDEIKFGDNDNLSALVTNVAEADLLLILTDVAGLYDSDPRQNRDAKLIPLVQTITRELERSASGSNTSVGTGGMATKLAAAKKASKNGVPTLMIPGKQKQAIIDAMNGNEIGTLFLASGISLNRRKQWIAYTLKTVGSIIVDDGAREVITNNGKSLLPSGIVQVVGHFKRGANIKICSHDGYEFARGLTDYSSSEINLLAGNNSSDIEKILGYYYGDVIVHRDNLVVM